MNLFDPQSLQTSVELYETNLVPNQIITPAKSTSVIGIVQDAVVGTYKLTGTDIGDINRQRYYNILMWHDTFTGDIGKNQSNYNGQSS